LKVYETGAKVLESIPESVSAHTNVDFSALPRILASCDGIVRDESSGSLLVQALALPATASNKCLSIPLAAGEIKKVVEAKHRFPFVLSQSGAGFTYMGKSRKPQEQISCEQFAQCQLQMLVFDVSMCDLISFSLGGSRIFHLQRDDRWLAIALEILAHMNARYIQQAQQPQPDALMTEKSYLHKSYITATKTAMHRLARHPVSEVRSAVHHPALSPYFLNMEPPADERRVRVGERCSPLHCIHSAVAE
jgi:hypothetical protein